MEEVKVVHNVSGAADASQETVTQAQETKETGQHQKKADKDGHYIKVDLIKLLVGLLIVSVIVNLGMAGFLVWGYTSGKFMGKTADASKVPPIYEVDPHRQTLVSEDTYKVGKSDEQHGFKVTVDGIAFRSTETRVYITVENLSNEEVQFMAGAKAVLVDDQQNRYTVDYFGGEHEFWGPIPVNAKVSGWLKFEPVKAGAKTLTFIVPRVFSMKYPAWNVEIRFPVPGM